MAGKTLDPSQLLMSSQETLRREVHSRVDSQLLRQTETCPAHNREIECFCETCRQ